jgi:DNA mismatch repair ATPase MutS
MSYSSNAAACARMYGIPEEVIERAEEVTSVLVPCYAGLESSRELMHQRVHRYVKHGQDLRARNDGRRL